MTHNCLKKSLEQFILRLQTEYRYGINEHITFNTDVINALRFADLTHDIERLLQTLQNEPFLTTQELTELLKLFPEWKNL